MRTEHFLVLVLDSFGGNAESETRIQKLTFLAQKEKNIDMDLNFKWHHYGPYSSKLKSTLCEMKKSGLIEMENERRKTFMGDPYRVTKFHLTEEGEKLSNLTKKKINSNELNAVYSIVENYGYNPLSEILGYVYSAYSPEDL